MKVIPDPTIMGFSGKWPGSKLIMSHRTGKRVVTARQYVKPNNLAQQEEFAAKMAAISSTWAAAHSNFKETAKDYANGYNSLFTDENSLPVSGYSMFVKGCFEAERLETTLISDPVNDVTLVDLTVNNFAHFLSYGDNTWYGFIQQNCLPDAPGTGGTPFMIDIVTGGDV